MQTLNYKHLHYLWTIVKEGGVARAARRLHVTPQSISTQMRILSEAIGEPLLRRSGREVELTDVGRMVFEHAERGFVAFEDLKARLLDRPGSRGAQFRVGVSNVLGRSIAYRLLRPALALEPPPRLICRDGRLSDLLAELAVSRLDMVLSDRPMGAQTNVKAFNHLLTACGVTFLAAPEVARRLKGRFPKSLDGAPFLLHGEDSALRTRLVRWFEDKDIRPAIVGEFDDTALLKAFAQEGAGVFAAATPVAQEIAQQYQVVPIGKTADVIEQIYAISTERRVRHPAVRAICDTARDEVHGTTR